jgi:uncharacterized membrane protein YidH (DUF202 family)
LTSQLNKGLFVERLFAIILGLSLLIFGVGLFFNPRFHDTKHDFQYDFSGFNIYFGIALCILGVIILFLSFRKSNDIDKSSTK